MGFVLESPLPRTRLTWVVPVIALALLVIGGFVVYRATRPNLDPDTTARTAADVTVLLYTEQYDGEVDAVRRYPVVLRVLPGGCLGVDGANPAIAVFPVGAKVSALSGRVAVRVPTYSTRENEDSAVVLAPGDDVVPGGIVGGRPVSVHSFGGDLAAHVPRSCRRFRAIDVGAPYPS